MPSTNAGESTPPHEKPTDWRAFATLAEFRAATGQEVHGIELDYDVFAQVSPPNQANPYQVYHAADLDFQLRPGGKAVDAGVVIPTVNEDFVGKAPGLGALESGAPPPRYGPRWLTWQPFYR